jgi:RNA polymerase sigma factor for flagellar operon FliA
MYNAAGQINKEQLVQRFAPMVKRIACHLMARLPASVLLDDLVQNGMLGLLDAIGRFEAGVGAQFEAYAAQRVRGAMLDSLRENDWLPRSLRRSCRLIEAAIAQLQQENGSCADRKGARRRSRHDAGRLSEDAAGALAGTSWSISKT